MFNTVHIWLSGVPWLDMLELFIDVTLKGAVICLAASLATLFLHRSSAFIRNKVWLFALVGLLLLPVFSMFSPVWNLPILPDLAAWGTGSYFPAAVKPDPAGFVGPALPAPVSGGAQQVADASLSGGLPWFAWCILAWLAGGLLYLVWWLFSQAGVKRLLEDARPAGENWAGLVDEISRELGLRRRVRLLESRRVQAAITVGLFSPTVVVPADVGNWPPTFRRLVLSHELAHVKRWDTFIEAFALLVTAVYWVNPFVWFAVRRLRIERERDCDNAVLSTGAKPSDYAELLLNIAADLGHSAVPVWRMATISQSSNLKDRIMNILNHKVNRSRGSRRSAVLTGALVLALALPISASGLWNAQAEQKSEKSRQARSEEMKKKELEKMKQKDEEMKKAAQLWAEEKEKMTEKSAISPEEKVLLNWEKICSQSGSAACKVGTIMREKGIEAGTDAFYKLKQAGGGDYYFKESEFNTLGYVFLIHGKLDEAQAVFELNVKEYPESWNVYDSLGEACLAAEKFDEARKFYSRALQMNPEAKSAKDALKKLDMISKKTS